MSKKTVVIFSGGLDSTTLLWHLKASGVEIKALSINYGQRHKKELLQAAKLANLLGVEHKIVDLSNLLPLLRGSSQTDYTVEVPEGHYEDSSMRITVVPNRNSIMLNVAAAWAISLKYDSIAYGAHAGDHAVYPDCREEFVDALEKTLALADWHQVKIERPFVKMTKRDIAALAQKLSVPVESTWSCYKGGDLHCGKCGTCQERLWALDGLTDPTEYESKILAKVK